MKILRRLHSLFRKDKLDAEMTAEMRHHVDLQTELNIKAGMNAEDARYAAQRQFGNVTVIQEQVREARGWLWLEQFGQDGRYAIRQLARSPGFTVITVLTLALGIGGTTALFSMVDKVILNPVGGPEPERMVQIGQRATVLRKEAFQGVCPPVLEALLDGRDRFADLSWSFSSTLERQTEDFINAENGAYVSWDFFTTLQCQPMLGRGFLADEAVLVEQGIPTRDTAIMLSYAWWQSQWGGDRQILGRIIEMGGRHFTVVGVMPAHFRFPDQRTEYWLPAERIVVPPGRFIGPNLRAYARLKAGTTPAQTQAMLDTLAQKLMEDHPATDGYGAMWRMDKQSLRISLRPLSEALQDAGTWVQLRQTLLGLFGAVGFVLFIVCANVANLALARVERRQHELAVRAAVGAGRGRLMRQLLTENLILALLGGTAGLLVAAWGLNLLTAMNGMPRLRPVELDGGLLGVALLVSAVAAIFFGLAPMWRGGKVRVQALLADGGLNATGSRGSSYYRNALVIIQVAVTIVLLTGAGLMLLSVNRLLRVDPGFDPQNLLLVEAQLPWRKYDVPDRPERERLKQVFIDQVHDRLRHLRGVVAVGVQQRSFSQAFQFKGEGRDDLVVAEHAMAGTGTMDVFQAMRVPLLAGRYFLPEDAGQASPIIISETTAHKFWPGEAALGKELHRVDPKSRAFVVVGIVGDAKVSSYLSEVLPTVYHPFQAGWNQTRLTGGPGPQFVIRTTGNPGTIIPFVRHALQEIEPALGMPTFKVMQQVLYDSTLAQRTYRNYLGLFALLGLVLSAFGIYGVLAFSVARRTREIGIRMAIGAEAAQVRAMILQQGGRLVALGVVLGLAGTLGLTRFLQSQLFEVSPTDPLAMLAATSVLMAVALFACWLPARRAAKVDPVIALRAE